MRLFNEPAGKNYLVSKGAPEALVDGLDLLGISCIGNLVGRLNLPGTTNWMNMIS